MRHEFWRGGWITFAVSGVLGLAAGASPTASLIAGVACALVVAAGLRLVWGSSTDDDDESEVPGRFVSEPGLVTEEDSRRKRKWRLTGGLLVLMALTQVVSRMPDELGFIGRFVPVLWSACGLLGVVIITLHVVGWARSSKRGRAIHEGSDD